jgi:hypothetical protein
VDLAGKASRGGHQDGPSRVAQKSARPEERVQVLHDKVVVVIIFIGAGPPLCA